MNAGFIQLDRATSYVPGLSTVINIPQIIYKLFIINRLNKESFESDSINAYIADKSLVRCIVLLIPVLGNLAVLASDLINLAKNSKYNLSISTSVNNDIMGKIHETIEKEKEFDIFFSKSLVPILKRVKEDANILTTQIDNATKPIPILQKEIEATIDKSTTMTKKIECFAEQDHHLAEKIFDLIALGLIVYTASSLSTFGIFGALIEVKAWSIVRDKINFLLSFF